MSVYAVINSILFKRPIGSELIEEFHVPYMFNRWLSFYDPVVVPLANEFNQYLSLFPDKQMSFNFLNTALPKLKYQKIDYIKKDRKGTETAKAQREREEREQKINAVASNLEISKREAKMYVDMLNGTV
jgi:hypothetical protein